MKLLFVNIFYLLLLQACTSKYVLNGTRFITPETQGKRFKFSAEVNSGQATQTKFDPSSNSKNELKYDQLNVYNINAAAGLGKKIDFYLSHNFDSVPMMNLKWQIAGSSRAKLIPKNHKLAMTIGYGTTKTKIKDDFDLELDLIVKDVALLYGYRWKRKLLFYNSLSYTTYRARLDIASNPIFHNGLLISNNTDVISLLAGLEMTWQNFFLKGEAGSQLIKSERTSSRNSFLAGYGLGLRF